MCCVETYLYHAFLASEVVHGDVHTPEFYFLPQIVLLH